MIVPFNCAVAEFYAYVKAVPRFWNTINHLCDLRKFSC